MAKRGPKFKNIDMEKVKKLASIFCTVEEIAFVMGVSVNTIDRRCKEVLKEGRAIGRTSIKRMQFKRGVQDGNIGMLIWLGKQHLEQSDKNHLESHSFIQEFGEKEEIELNLLLAKALPYKKEEV